MSGYTQLVKKTFVFEGDNVEVQFRRMKRKHMLKLIPLINRYNKLQTEGEDANEALSDLIQEVMDIGGEYVSYITGLKDAEGNEVSKDQVFDEMYFTELGAEISMSLLEASLGPLGKKLNTSEESPDK